MLLDGITEPPDQTLRNSGNNFRLTKPLTLPNFVALRQKVCEISVVEKFCSPEKLSKVHHRFPDLSPIDRPYTSFHRHSVISLALLPTLSVIFLPTKSKSIHVCQSYSQRWDVLGHGVQTGNMSVNAVQLKRVEEEEVY